MTPQFKRLLAVGAVAAAVGTLSGAGADRASAAGLGKVLGKGVKVLGIGFAVKQFGPQINKLVNTVLGQKGLAYDGATKVVPILSLGNGAHIGGAQVQGPEEQVRQVKGVGQVEVPLGRVRGKALIPVDTLTPTKGYDKVKGTGVSAIIDFRI